jgi:hypothetical protein
MEPHHALLIPSGPQQNFVEVEKDFSDLEEKMEYLLDNPQKAQAIAQASAETFRDRYLTPAAQTCYWRRLITEWANVSFVPDEWVIVNKSMHNGGVLPFETFV